MFSSMSVLLDAVACDRKLCWFLDKHMESVYVTHSTERHICLKQHEQRYGGMFYGRTHALLTRLLMYNHGAPWSGIARYNNMITML